MKRYLVVLLLALACQRAPAGWAEETVQGLPDGGIGMMTHVVLQ